MPKNVQRIEFRSRRYGQRAEDSGHGGCMAFGLFFFFLKKKVVTKHPPTSGQLRVTPSRCDQLDTQRKQKRAADMMNCQRSDTSTLHRPAAAI